MAQMSYKGTPLNSAQEAAMPLVEWALRPPGVRTTLDS